MTGVWPKLKNQMQIIHLSNLIDLKIIEDFSEFEDEALGDDIDLEDTMALLKEYVDVVEAN